MDLQLTRLVVFSILMENGEGIASKAPPYIMEKWRAVMLCNSADSMIGLLDQWNHHKYVNWLATWAKHLDGLNAAAPPAEISEAVIDDFVQSEKSKSVVIEAKDVADIDEVLGRQQTLGEPGEKREIVGEE